LHSSGIDGRARRRKASKRAVCVCLWRADACAQGVRVTRTACVRYASSPGRGQSKEQRAWTAWRRSVSYQLCRVRPGRLSMPTKCARLHWPHTVKVVALSKLLSPCCSCVARPKVGVPPLASHGQFFEYRIVVLLQLLAPNDTRLIPRWLLLTLHQSLPAKRTSPPSLVVCEDVHTYI